MVHGVHCNVLLEHGGVPCIFPSNVHMTPLHSVYPGGHARKFRMGFWSRYRLSFESAEQRAMRQRDSIMGSSQKSVFTKKNSLRKTFLIDKLFSSSKIFLLLHLLGQHMTSNQGKLKSYSEQDVSIIISVHSKL